MPIKVRFSRYGFAKVRSTVKFELIDRWSSMTTWGCQDHESCKPVQGDLVEVPKGTRILLDESTPILKAILVSGGTLKIADSNVTLELEYLIVTNGGRVVAGIHHNYLLRIVMLLINLKGSEEDPITSSVEIRLHGNPDSHQLPLYGSKVIAVHSGALKLFGSPKVTWSTLKESAQIGEDQIILNSADHHWTKGDEIVVVTDGGPGSIEQNELRKIVEIHGGKITLDLPLQFNHSPKTVEFGGITRYLEIEVINLSRSIKIVGVLSETNPMFGAHLVASNETEVVNLAFVELTNVGQAFRLGKYPIHFHLAGSHQHRQWLNNKA